MINTIFLKVLLAKLKMISIYKKDFLLGVFSSFLKASIGILFIDLIFYNFNNISGFDYYTTRYLYFSISFIQSVVYFFCMGLIDFSNLYIKNGELDIVLLKPVNKIIYIILDNINIKEIPNFIINFIIFVSTIFKLNYNIYSSLLLFLTPFMGVISVLSLMLVINSFSFIYKDTLMANKFIISLTDISRYPLKIYPKFIKIAVTFIVPLSLSNYVPILFLNNLTLIIIISFLIVMILFYLSIQLFKKAFSFYQSTGS